MSAGIGELDRMVLIAEAWHRSNKSKIVDVITSEHVRETFNYELVQVITGGKVVTQDEDGNEVVTWVEADEAHQRAILRTNPHYFLASMGGKYGLNQPGPYFEAIAETVLKAGFPIESVGTLGNGAKAFLSARLPAEFDFDFQGYSAAGGVLNFGDSCDGSAAMRGTHAMNIVVCQNTFNAYLLGVPALFKIKHTANSEAIVDETLRQLDQALETTKQIKAAVERLTNEVLTHDQFRSIITSETMLGERPEKDSRERTMWDKKFGEMMARYNNADIDPIRETKLGALMAVQGFEQHVRPIRKQAERAGRNIAEVVFGEQALSAKMSALLGIAPKKGITALV